MKLIASFLTLFLLSQTAPTVAAKPKGDWTAVKKLLNYSIAVKTTKGEKHFGRVEFVDDDGIRILIAGKENFTFQEVGFRRGDIEKLWVAELRFGEKNIGKGAWIGAGAGLGAAFLTALALRGTDDAAIGLGAFPIYGAAIGAFAGVFWKKKHKKQELIYSI